MGKTNENGRSSTYSEINIAFLKEDVNIDINKGIE